MDTTVLVVDQNGKRLAEIALPDLTDEDVEKKIQLLKKTLQPKYRSYDFGSFTLGETRDYWDYKKPRKVMAAVSIYAARKSRKYSCVALSSGKVRVTRNA